MTTTTTPAKPYPLPLRDHDGDDREQPGEVKVWGWCADFCETEGRTNGQTVADHGAWCESVNALVRGTTDAGAQVDVSVTLRRPYGHGIYDEAARRGLVRDDVLHIGLSGLDDPDTRESLGNVEISPAQARSLAAALLHFADASELPQVHSRGSLRWTAES